MATLAPWWGVEYGDRIALRLLAHSQAEAEALAKAMGGRVVMLTEVSLPPPGQSLQCPVDDSIDC